MELEMPLCTYVNHQMSLCTSRQLHVRYMHSSTPLHLRTPAYTHVAAIRPFRTSTPPPHAFRAKVRGGPAFLIYYAPALLQRNNKSKAALRKARA